jgi:glycosyltransferase involved in cell wall biosynthesis
VGAVSGVRIAWVVPGFASEHDERCLPALTALAQAVATAHELRVFAVRYPTCAARYAIGGVAVQSFGRADEANAAPMARQATSAARWARVLRAIARDHRRAPFSVIHGFWATESGMLAALAGRRLGVPALVSGAGGELAAVGSAGYGSRLHVLERAQVALTLHLATRIGVGSEDYRRRLLADYPWLRARTRMLPLGYDPAVFALPPDHVRAVPGRIVCVASWSPVKGHSLLLQAMRLVAARDERAHLVLVGERTDGPEAMAAIAAHGLARRVQTLGAVTQRDVAGMLATAQAATITSWHEAQGLAIVEALACGAPVVATPVGIARELLRDPALGACVPGRSPAALADALLAQLRLGEQHDPAARARRRCAVSHLALPAVAARFLDAYQRLPGFAVRRGDR